MERKGERSPQITEISTLTKKPTIPSRPNLQEIEPVDETSLAREIEAFYAQYPIRW